MGKMKLESYVKLTFLSLSLSLLIACTSEEVSKNKTEESTKESQTEKKNKNQTSLKENIQNSPKTTDELIQYPGGKHAGKSLGILPEDEKKQVHKDLDEFPKITEDASKKKRRNYIGTIYYICFRRTISILKLY